jgi:hypothetical protein
MWGTPSDERTGLPFTIAASPRQRSHSWVRVPRDSWPYFTVSDSRLPQSGGPGSRIYIPQEQGGPVIPPGTAFPFRRLLRLAGLRWRYSNLPPREFIGPLPALCVSRMTENIASSIVASWTVISEPLPGNVLIISVKILYSVNCINFVTWTINSGITNST